MDAKTQAEIDEGDKHRLKDDMTITVLSNIGWMVIVADVQTINESQHIFSDDADGGPTFSSQLGAYNITDVSLLAQRLLLFIYEKTISFFRLFSYSHYLSLWFRLTISRVLTNNKRGLN